MSESYTIQIRVDSQSAGRSLAKLDAGLRKTTTTLAAMDKQARASFGALDAGAKRFASYGRAAGQMARGLDRASASMRRMSAASRLSGSGVSLGIAGLGGSAGLRRQAAGIRQLSTAIGAIKAPSANPPRRKGPPRGVFWKEVLVVGRHR